MRSYKKKNIFYYFINYEIIFYLIKYIINFYLNENIFKNMLIFFKHYLIIDIKENKFIYCCKLDDFFENVRKINLFINFNVIKLIIEYYDKNSILFRK